MCGLIVMNAVRWCMRHSSGSSRNYTVAMAMSGGIDSSVGAMLLQEQGHDVRGVFMRNWDRSDEEGANTCPIDQDYEDAREVCERLKIPLYEVSFAKEYWTEVFAPLLADYQSGIRTPNPDVSCNRAIKFNRLLDFALMTMRCDKLATGHYCQITSCDNESRLLRGLDSSKDQSYFLSTTAGEALSRALFPVGHLNKTRVKQLAAERFKGLRVVSKRESMGVCFIGKRKMRDFLPQYIDVTPGKYIDIDSGEVLGNHSGAEILTPGQGARIGGMRSRYYIVNKYASNGDVLVADRWDHPQLLQTQITIPLKDMHWINGVPDELLNNSNSSEFCCFCQTRHLQPAVKCIVSVVGTDLRVQFATAVRAVVPGQAAAFYSTMDGKHNEDVNMNVRCLGGGAIAAVR